MGLWRSSMMREIVYRPAFLRDVKRLKEGYSAGVWSHFRETIL